MGYLANELCVGVVGGRQWRQPQRETRCRDYRDQRNTQAKHETPGPPDWQLLLKGNRADRTRWRVLGTD